MSTAVLLSGGLDSAVLLAEEAVSGTVQPIYVSVGLAWEAAERAMIARLLAAPALAGRTRPLAALAVDMRDVYDARHWAIQGQPPAYHTPDEDVYLPGRNVVLLGKAGVFAAAAGLSRIVIGTLAHNPFPDATPVFRSAMAQALSLGLAHELRIDAPYAEVGKADVIRRGHALGVPFELTLSCMNPTAARGSLLAARGHDTGGAETAARAPEQRETSNEQPEAIHCGLCSKCRERHDAFLEAGISDPTTYADERFVHA